MLERTRLPPTYIPGPGAPSHTPGQTAERAGIGCERKQEKFSHEVIIHYLKKENLPATETGGGGEAGSSKKYPSRTEGVKSRSGKERNNRSHCFPSTVPRTPPPEFTSHPRATCHVISFFKIKSHFIFILTFNKILTPTVN